MKGFNQINLFLEVQINATSHNIYSKTKMFKANTANHFIIITSSKTKIRLLYVSPIILDWFNDESTTPHTIMLGQTFLANESLTQNGAGPNSAAINEDEDRQKNAKYYNVRK